MPVLVSFVTFTAMTTITGESLKASTAFTALALFNSLRHPLLAMPDIIVKVGEALIALKRVEKYLEEVEVEESVNRMRAVTDLVPNSPVQFIDNSNYQWSSLQNVAGSEDSRNFMLKNLSIKVSLFLPRSFLPKK